ncbi:MAG: hypothetical protein JXB50_05975, partial [Spirochaetes bacterium]|nr:hypothetical protein [Spirochaetota bacterium]
MNLKNLRKELKKFLNITIVNKKIGFDVIETVGFTKFKRLLIKYVNDEHEEIKAYFFMPEGQGPFPAVLVHHQHNSERHFGKSEVSGIIGDKYQAFCPVLAENNIIAIAPDSINFEDRRRNKKGTEPDKNTDLNQHFNEMSYRLLKGELLLSRIINDSSIALSILYYNEKVDSNKIAVLGHSYGGSTSAFHSAFDERIRYSCLSGAICSFKHKIQNNIALEYSQVIPGFIKKYEMTDILKCIFPRNLLIMSSTDDKYTKDSHEIYSEIKNIYIKHDIEKNLGYKNFNGSHNLNIDNFRFIIEWLKKNLKN